MLSGSHALPDNASNSVRAQVEIQLDPNHASANNSAGQLNSVLGLGSVALHRQQ